MALPPTPTLVLAATSGSSDGGEVSQVGLATPRDVLLGQVTF